MKEQKNTAKPKMQRIKFGDRALPCRVTMGAMLRFKRETGHDVKQMRGDDIEEVVTFLWCCMTSACHADKITDIPDLEEFADALEPGDLEEFYGSMGAEVEVVKKTVPPTEEIPAEA